jgi:hypothetical protein
MFEDISSAPRPKPLTSAADYYELAPIAKGEGVGLPPPSWSYFKVLPD